MQAFPFLLSIYKRLGSLIVKVEFFGGRLILSHKINDFFASVTPNNWAGISLMVRLKEAASLLWNF